MQLCAYESTNLLMYKLAIWVTVIVLWGHHTQGTAVLYLYVYLHKFAESVLMD